MLRWRLGPGASCNIYQGVLAFGRHKPCIGSKAYKTTTSFVRRIADTASRKLYQQKRPIAICTKHTSLPTCRYFTIAERDV